MGSVARLAKAIPGGERLDIGCGDGQLELKLMRLFDLKIEGVDIVPRRRR